MNESIEIAALMKQLAEDTVAWVRDSYEANLDYSEESIEIVERLLEELHNELPRSESGELLADESTTDTIDAICNMVGGYLGETIRRLHGGEWTINNLAAEQPMVSLQVQNISLFPTAKVYKRLAYGAGDNIPFFYSALKNQLQRLGDDEEQQPEDESGLEPDDRGA
jgi:hypothetical protein